MHMKSYMIVSDKLNDLSSKPEEQQSKSLF